MVLKTKLLIIAANLMSFQAQPQQAQLPTFSQPAVVMGSNNLTADQSLIIVNLESSFSHAAAAVALLGVLLNLLFLRTLIKHRATLLQTAHSYIGPGIFVLCTVSVFHGTLIVIESELWISSLWVDNSPLSNRGFSNSLAGLGYCFLTFLFETNFVLALERYWTIKYAEKVPKRVIGQITGVTILVALLFIISFGLAPNSGWFFTPMGLPLSHDYSSLRLTHPSIILFLIACCYFPAIAVACCFVYENTYFNIAAVYEQMHDVHEREGRRRANEAIHLNRKILIRCIVMSIGLFVWVRSSCSLLPVSNSVVCLL
ncbi:hypothetical protein BC830DRAFT_792249 [Chytriomyces sp. MP71]|nr:hypothetical protein BC830DRAFT_792249 [Chytriomyces sp. MP71]